MQNVTNERGETKSKPKCVVDYNDQMGGADKVDQHLAPYFTSRKREENTNIFFHLLIWPCEIPSFCTVNQEVHDHLNNLE
ncbi:hypothetical protein TNCV_1356431 [Trichonephila clavipes]|uniref:PiggyBac transposable element-derived protein domain-containing protein n=1 Tax=Trichonephila clavipes TaxID=2585209 RepID=A0A8X6SB99_TRICX|nr:hypothetical protein TNCV_4158251 [Trichonephila clavipes]GFY08233.1 hypothetical protein TNCV_1356431 [Trichonephila clavipes]